MDNSECVRQDAGGEEAGLLLRMQFPKIACKMQFACKIFVSCKLQAVTQNARRSVFRTVAGARSRAARS